MLMKNKELLSSYAFLEQIEAESYENQCTFKKEFLQTTS